MESKVTFRVFDKDGNDVTDKGCWYIDSTGWLYMETNDVDAPLQVVTDHTYQVTME